MRALNFGEECKDAFLIVFDMSEMDINITEIRNNIKKASTKLSQNSVFHANKCINHKNNPVI